MEQSFDIIHLDSNIYIVYSIGIIRKSEKFLNTNCNKILTSNIDRLSGLFDRKILASNVPIDGKYLLLESEAKILIDNNITSILLCHENPIGKQIRSKYTNYDEILYTKSDLLDIVGIALLSIGQTKAEIVENFINKKSTDKNA